MRWSWGDGGRASREGREEVCRERERERVREADSGLAGNERDIENSLSHRKGDRASNAGRIEVGAAMDRPLPASHRRRERESRGDATRSRVCFRVSFRLRPRRLRSASEDASRKKPLRQVSWLLDRPASPRAFPRNQPSAHAGDRKPQWRSRTGARCRAGRRSSPQSQWRGPRRTRTLRLAITAHSGGRVSKPRTPASLLPSHRVAGSGGHLSSNWGGVYAPHTFGTSVGLVASGRRMVRHLFGRRISTSSRLSDSENSKVLRAV